MALTLNTHIPSFTNLVVWIYVPAFRSQAAIISEKSIVFAFSYKMCKLPNLTLVQNRSRSTYGHHLNKL